MNTEQLRERIHSGIDQHCAPLTSDPYLMQRVLKTAKTEGGIVSLKKRNLIIILLLMLILSSLTAYATTLLVGHDVKLYEAVNVIDLLPDQYQEYDICHRIKQGYVIGGFSLEDDYIAPMDKNDSIILLDESFQTKWILSDARLEGCLFDKVIETKEAIYFGLEGSKDGWVGTLMKVGITGEIEWFHTSDSNIRLKDFVVDSNGSTICVGHITEENVPKPYIVFLDSNGNVEQERVLSELPLHSLSAIHNGNGSTVLAGYGDRLLWVGALESDGSFRWQAFVDLDEYVQTLRLQTNQNGDYVITVVYKDASNGDATKRLQYYVVKP